MFLEIAIGAIGIAVVLMVGYLIIAQVRVALLSPNTLSNETIAGINSAQTVIFAGFGLVAVGVIVLAAFGLISVFR